MSRSLDEETEVIREIMKQAREQIQELDRLIENSNRTSDEFEEGAIRSPPKRKRARKVKRRSVPSSESDDSILESSDEDYLPPSQNSRRSSSRLRQRVLREGSEIPIVTIESDDDSIIDVESGDEEVTICLFCGSERENIGELWLRCSMCKNYYHQGCTVHVDKTHQEMRQYVFICQSCF